jgi:hypothetical protein
LNVAPLTLPFNVSALIMMISAKMRFAVSTSLFDEVRLCFVSFKTFLFINVYPIICNATHTRACAHTHTHTHTHARARTQCRQTLTFEYFFGAAMRGVSQIFLSPNQWVGLAMLLG